jgi:hypothetical protein
VNKLAGYSSARPWLSAEGMKLKPAYVADEFKARCMAAYCKPGGVAASMKYYKAQMHGVLEVEEGALTDVDRTLRVPVLRAGGTRTR